MQLRTRLTNLLRNLFRRQRVERDLDEEVRSYVELLAEEKRARGLSAEEALRSARIELGGAEQVKEQVRDARAGAWLDSLLQDFRYALRMLRKNPGLTAIVTLTLALGIGVNTSVFALFDSVLLLPLPVPEPDRVTVVTRAGRPLFSYPDYVDYRDANQSFEALTASNLTESSLDYGGESHPAAAETVSGSYSQVVQARPFLGRWFIDESEPVAVISFDAWQRIFDADPKHSRETSPIRNPVVHGDWRRAS